MMLANAAVDLPARVAQVEAILPVARQWSDPDAQYQAQLKGIPYDLLRAADAILPPDASVLLVTSGRDVTRTEYVNYHRALYFLAPRPVWWLSPAPSDGTWKSRWWISAPLTPESIRQQAANRNVSYVLVVGVTEPLGLEQKLIEVGDGYLAALAVGAHRSESRQTQQYVGALWPLQVAAAVAVIVAIGGMVVLSARWLGYSPGRIEGMSLAWSLGSGVTSILMLWLSAIGLSLQWQLAVITSIAFAWSLWRVARWVQLRQHRSVPREPMALANGMHGREERWTKYLRLGLVTLLAVQVGMVSITAIGRPLEVWDSWANWGFKARTIFLEGYVSPAVYADASHAVTQLDYPLMVPLVQAWLYGWVGAPDDRLAGVPSVLFYLALVALCFTGMRRLGVGHTAALAATVAIATIGHLAGLAAIVFAEMPLIVICAIAGVYMVKWLAHGSLGALLVSAIAAGLMPWMKKEGLIVLAALAAAIVVTNLKDRRAWAGISAWALAAGVIAGPWWLFVAYNSIVNGIVNPAFLPITPETLAQTLGRAETIASLALGSMFSPAMGYVWPLVALGGALVALGQRSMRRRPEDFLPLGALMFVVLIACSYFFSAFVPYKDHILSSVDRLILLVTPLIVIWLVVRAGALPGNTNDHNLATPTVLSEGPS